MSGRWQLVQEVLFARCSAEGTARRRCRASSGAALQMSVPQSVRLLSVQRGAGESSLQCGEPGASPCPGKALCPCWERSLADPCTRHSQGGCSGTSIPAQTCAQAFHFGKGPQLQPGSADAAELAVPHWSLLSFCFVLWGRGGFLRLLQWATLPRGTGRGPRSSVSITPVWSLQESGESYLEKAEKMYSQMYSTREKVRAAPRRGNRVLLVWSPWEGSLFS